MLYIHNIGLNVEQMTSLGLPFFQVGLALQTHTGISVSVGLCFTVYPKIMETKKLLASNDNGHFQVLPKIF